MDSQSERKFQWGTAIAFVLLHLGAVVGGILTWRSLTWSVFFLGLFYFCYGGLSITIGYHRFWTHKAFECHERLQRLLAVGGTLPAEESVKKWRDWHRRHHAFTDKVGDPHSPLVPLNGWNGFWWSHIGWMLYSTPAPAGYRPTAPYEDRDPIVLWQQRWYWPLCIGIGFVLPTMLFGWQGLVWCGFVRVVLFWHITWAINSICHLWGTRPKDARGEYLSNDQSRNNVPVALLSFGEGYHGNHHGNPFAAYLGYNWYDIDPGKWVICILQSLGLVWNLRYPIRK